MNYKNQYKSLPHFFLFFFSFFLIMGCSKSNGSLKENEQINEDENDSIIEFNYNLNVANPNILLIIADDMGMDATPYATDLASIKPNMPNLDKLTQKGVRFTNTWSYPRCAPTRASILTGKHAVETGVLSPGDAISTSETTIQSFINNGNTPYATSLIGKWHLSRDSTDPENMHIDFYKGNTGGGLTDYYNWTLQEDGTDTQITNYYGTTAYTDYAIDWINQQNKPWFCWLAYNAAHTTFHTPKDDTLYTHTGNSTLDMYLQMLEAMDAEIGRLLNTIPKETLANTTIIFIGDNGTPAQVAQTPFSRSKAKGSLFNGGINVPLIVAGANVSRENKEENALIQSTDLFATIADLCNVSNIDVDESISFKSLLTQEKTHSRKFLFTEGLSNGPAFGGYTVRNEKYKLIYDDDDQINYLYNVLDDYAETINLYDGNLTTEEQTAVTELQAEAGRILN